ncbi:TetR/AcrR family transcriptional regulator [Pseudonocardia cypriaca]|uniref:AcrR family transcriptional regulator n=1 Tax=Pseudonocardia cypriaca TaxID=882449 RepID=A0A543FYQ5_9PSEU|nr:TetR/AcrR family transcriptional regulator [Pseudonocardia cypriaca]TQM38957.1 AcrR family transcriptional regulator [Pseudonocardia cypriaca]
MGIPRTRRRLTPDERRAELIDAAVRLLRSGREVSNWAQAVTTEADAAKGTFYLYFSSWDDMLVAVRDRVQQEYVTRYRELAESPERLDWWAVLDAECDAAIDFIAQPSGLHHAVFHSAAVLAPIDDDVDIIGAIARFLSRGIEEGAFRAVDARAAAAFLFAVVHAAADAIAAGDGADRWRSSVRDLTRSWLGRTDG